MPSTSCKKAQPGTRRLRRPLPLHPAAQSGALGSRPPRRCLRRGLLLCLLLLSLLLSLLLLSLLLLCLLL